tara:strand:+ start:757 stop:1134 length:378 start_codon:yes stop_codon:yes gene_type:complete
MRGNDKVAEVIPIGQASGRTSVFQPYSINLSVLIRQLEESVCGRFFLTYSDKEARLVAVPLDGESEYVKGLLELINRRVLGTQEVRLERRFKDETHLTLTTEDTHGRSYVYSFQLDSAAFADHPG